MDSRDDREVEEGDRSGESKGEFETELEDDEATGSAELVFCRPILRLATDGDMLQRDSISWWMGKGATESVGEAGRLVLCSARSQSQPCAPRDCFIRRRCQ